MDGSKKAVPVPVEKALKGLHSFLILVKEDLVCGLICSMSTQDSASKFPLREKRVKLLEHLKAVGEVLPKHIKLDKPENAKEQELVELVKSAATDINKNFPAAQTRWVDLLLDKVSDILDSTQHVNLERLTSLMEQNDIAGSKMDGKEVILLLGSPGAGKTTTLHYLAGTSFREISKGGVKLFRPVDVMHPDCHNMKISSGGKDVITRHMQVAEMKVDGKPVIICDTPSFGNHEAIEEVIANSLGLVRAIQRAQTVRPVLVLSRDEVGFRETFNAYPQIMAVLIRLLGSDSSVDLKPFRFIFTKYDSNSVNVLRHQFSTFLKDDEGDSVNSGNKNDANKNALIRHLINHTDLEVNVVIPTNGDPSVFLRKLMEGPAVENPKTYFVPNMPEVILTTLKRQLKFTLLDLRDALSRNENATAIHRMQQMSKLANLLPEAGIFARHGFKAFKEIINLMVEDGGIDDDDDDEPDIGVNRSGDSGESWTSSESEQWSNVSSKLCKAASHDFWVQRQLSIISEEVEEVEVELGRKRIRSDDASSTKSGPSQALLDLAEKCKQPQQANSVARETCKSPFSSSASSTVSSPIECRSPFSSSASSTVSSPITLPTFFRDIDLKNSQENMVQPPQPPNRFQAQPTKLEGQNPAYHQPAQVQVQETNQRQPQTPAQQAKELQSQSRQDEESLTPVQQNKEFRAQPSQPNSFRSKGPNTSAQKSQSAPYPSRGPSRGPTTPVQPYRNTQLPDEEVEYAEHYSTMLKEMTIKAIEEEDYVLAVQRMQEFIKLARANPDPGVDHGQFKKCVELFLVFSVALQEANYPKCLHHMQQLIAMAETGNKEAQKCSQCGVKAAIQHITEMRERVVRMTAELHEIEDPDKFDRVLEQLRTEREKVEQSNILLETCMSASDDKGKSQTVLACISYGFKVGRFTR